MKRMSSFFFYFLFFFIFFPREIVKPLKNKRHQSQRSQKLATVTASKHHKTQGSDPAKG